MKRIKCLLALFFTLTMMLTALPASARETAQPPGGAARLLAEEEAVREVEQLSLYATAAVLMDAGSGRVLYEKNGAQPMAMASTTKIMTCIIALENGNPLDEVDISAYAAGMPKVKLFVQKGERYVLGDLLRSLMLESHNDSAVAIAEHIGKGFLSPELQAKSAADFTAEESKQAVAAYAALMNRKAQDLGCADTWFITPNGLDATQTFTLDGGETVQKEHCTTAADLARIMAYCIRQSPKKAEFLEITRMPNHCFSANGRSFSCNNHNAFLNMMDGALSGKTGFTNKAGYCYVGALERDGKTFTVALLACGWPNHKTYKWSDTRALMEYGLNHYSYHSFDEVAYQESKLPRIPVMEGQTDRLGETAYIDVEIIGRHGSDGAGTTDNAGTTGGAGTADNAGMTDGAGTADNAGMTDGAGTAGNAGMTDGAGTADNAGTTGGAGTADNAGMMSGVGTADNAGMTDGAGMADIAGMMGGAGTAGSAGTADNAGMTGGAGTAGGVGISGDAENTGNMESAAGGLDGGVMREAQKAGVEGLLLREDETIDVTCRLKEKLQAPVEAGTEVGTVYYSVNGQIYKTEQIVTRDGVGKIDLPWCFRQIWNRFFMYI